MPSLLAFDLVCESDQDFEARTGWVYNAGSPAELPGRLLSVGQP